MAPFTRASRAPTLGIRTLGRAAPTVQLTIGHIFPHGDRRESDSPPCIEIVLCSHSIISSANGAFECVAFPADIASPDVTNVRTALSERQSRWELALLGVRGD